MVIDPKQRLKEETLGVLDEAGFIYSKECNLYPKSFEYAAKRDDTRLLLKLLVDINNLKRDVAERVRELSSLLLASPFLIGKRNKGKAMEPGVVYERHGIKSVNCPSLNQRFRKGLVCGLKPTCYAVVGFNVPDLRAS